MRIAREVVESLGAPLALIPVLSTILAPLPSLGAMPGEVVRLLREAGLKRDGRVLELACGKGSVAVAIAAKLECRVLAVDWYTPFLTEANLARERAGVQRLCRFEHGDVEEYEGGKGRFDAAVMLNLYPCGRAARLLRGWVKPGGVYVLDDAFRGKLVREQTKGVPTREHCRRAIEQWGDRIENEFVPTPSQVRGMSRRRLAGVRAAGMGLAREYPRYAGPVKKYLKNLAASGRLLGGAVRPAIWVVRRGSGAHTVAP